MNIGRKIYYDITTGNLLLDTGELAGSVVPSTIDQDVLTFKELSERNRESFDVIELEYGQFAQDFTECSGYRVNPQTKEIEFSYPEPNQPEQPPVYQEPLTEQVKRLKDRQDATEEAMLGLLLGGM